MPRTKVHSPTREKRKFTGSQYAKKSSSSNAAVSLSKETIEESGESSSGEEELVGSGVKSKSESFKSLPASVRKLESPLRKWKMGYTDTLQANQEPSYETAAF